jgi:hypothetical protein
VVRYGALGKSTKWLTAAEVTALRAAGLEIVANVEESAGGYRGAAAGTAWATAGDAFFRALGMGADRPIYFSVDWDAQPSDWADIDAALTASGAVLGFERVGVYGSYATIEHCRSAGTAAWFWQTYAWSAGRWSAACNLQQYKNSQTVAGGAVDLDRSMTTDYGQWGTTVATSQNGWPVATAAQQDNGLYAGATFPNGALAGDVAFVFRWLITQLHTRVEKVKPGACWGWFVKPVAGQTTGYSNHSSGTAMDFNAEDHPLGAESTFTTAQVAEIHAILAEADGVIRWGGDYSGRKDPMHFEVVKTPAAVKALRAKLEDDVTKDELKAWMTEWAKSADGKAALAVAALTHDPGADANGKTLPGGVVNYGTDAPTNPTVQPAYALGRAEIAAILGYQLRDLLTALGPKVDAILSNVVSDDGDLAAIRDAITAAQTGTISGVIDALTSAGRSDAEIAFALEAALGSRAASVGALLAGK